MPFYAEKRPSLLYESEGIFVALLVNQSFVVTKARQISWCCAAILRANTIGDSAGDGKKKRHTMSTESRNGSDIDPENVIAVTLDDLSKDDRQELEQELKIEMVEQLKLKLTGYCKTRIGVVKKVHVPNPSDLINTEVKKSTEEISHLIDVCIATKYDSDVKLRHT